MSPVWPEWRENANTDAGNVIDIFEVIKKAAAGEPGGDIGTIFKETMDLTAVIEHLRSLEKDKWDEYLINIASHVPAEATARYKSPVE